MNITAEIAVNEKPAVSVWQKGLLQHLLICTAFFSLYCIWFRTPLVADDHRFLWLSVQEKFDFWGLGECISRTPVYAPVFYLLLKLDYHQSSFYFFFIILFAAHCASVFLISERIMQILKVPAGGYGFLRLLPAIVLSFHPNFLEILFMPGAAIYVLGALLMALSFYAESWYLRFLLSILAFGTYETYLLPAFAFYLVPLFSGPVNKPAFFSAAKKMIPVALALLCFVGLRMLLALKTGTYQQPVNPDLVQNGKRLLRYWFQVFTTGYPNRWSNLAESLLYLMLLLLQFRKGLSASMRPFFTLLILGLLSAALDLLVPYEGIRVIYGSYFFKAAALIFLFRRCEMIFSSGLVYLMILLMLPVYGANLVSLYRIRLHNYRNQKDVERLVSGVFRETESSKTLLLPPTGLHFHPDDWELEPNSTIQYKLFRFLGHHKKDFEYRVIGYDNLNFREENLPLFYPSRAFVYHGNKAWERDERSLTGQVFRVQKGFHGKAVYGPYILLEPGSYRLELAMRCGTEAPAVTEFGGLEITAQNGLQWISSSPFKYPDFSAGKFRTVVHDFQVKSNDENLELCVFTNGQIDFYIDYMRLSKVPLP
jgi:hypothetical protein